MDDEKNSFKKALDLGVKSAKQNALPGLFLWCLALGIVLLWLFVPEVKKVLEALGRIKESSGLLYSALATALFGGFIPFLWTTFAFKGPQSAQRSAGDLLKRAAFFLLFWAWKGIEVDLFYQLQALLFGTEAKASVIIPKVVMDQFVYNPLWAGPSQIVAYYFLDNQFSFKALKDRSLWRSMPQRMLSVLLSTWAIWIPMVSIIYSMPANLQIPLFNLVLCFWSLLLASLTREKAVQ